MIERLVIDFLKSKCLVSRNLTFFSFSFLFMAVPFDEDEKDPSVWFLDHDYLENMYGMFKKVNGMCHTGCLSTKFVWSNLLNMQGLKLRLIRSPMLLTFSPW